MRRAPSRQISSSIERPSSPAGPSFTTLNIGVPSSPARHRRLLVLDFNEEGTPRPRGRGRSTTSGPVSGRGTRWAGADDRGVGDRPDQVGRRGGWPGGPAPMTAGSTDWQRRCVAASVAGDKYIGVSWG